MMKNLCFILLAAAIVVSSQKYRDDDEFVPEIMAEDNQVINGTDREGRNGCSSKCVFPFVWNGVTYQHCTDVDDTRLWCGTGIGSDGSLGYTYCDEECPSRRCSSKCVFPFVWNGVTYQHCTDVDDTRLWCGTGIGSDGSLGYTYCDEVCTSRGTLNTAVGQRRLNTGGFDDSQSGDDSLAGFILIHGIGIALGPSKFCEAMTRSKLAGLGLSSKTLVRCPATKRRPVGVMPPTFIPGLQFARSWFNFWMMPAMSVLSPVPGESKKDLDRALGEIEEVIEELMSKGVPSKNIVVSGVSQGGVLTIYTALHSQYKLGGFIPIVAWLPLLKVEPVSSLPVPVNKDTPMFHINGMMDFIVPVVPAGRESEKELKKVFPRYSFKAIPGTTHVSTALNPLTMPILKKWLKANTNIKFGGGLSDILGGGGGSGLSGIMGGGGSGFSGVLDRLKGGSDKKPGSGFFGRFG